MPETNSHENLVYTEFEEYILGTFLSYPLTISSIHNFNSDVFSDSLNKEIAKVIEDLVSYNMIEVVAALKPLITFKR